MAKTKKDKKIDLLGLSKEELLKKLAELRSSLLDIRFKSEGSRSKNVKESSVLKKSIARILTEQNRRKREDLQKGK